MLLINGALGGGQILRTSLALSMCLGVPFRMINIRSYRKRPGLLPQHLAAVNAASQICSAEIEGAKIHSQELSFCPHAVSPGEYHFSIGTAGSTTLLLQTILPVFLTATAPSKLVLEGGTHNPLAPPFDFLEMAFLPLINRMGPNVTATLERSGFYPAGGGKLEVNIQPTKKLNPFQLLERGAISEIYAVASISNLPQHIAQRELDVIGRELALTGKDLQVRNVVPAKGPGNTLIVVIRSQYATEVITGFGMRGVSAETVAGNVAHEVKRYLQAEVPVGEHLADQLLLPLALAGGGSYKTLQPTKHTTTNIQILEQFMDIKVSCRESGVDNYIISIGV